MPKRPSEELNWPKGEKIWIRHRLKKEDKREPGSER